MQVMVLHWYDAHVFILYYLYNISQVLFIQLWLVASAHAKAILLLYPWPIS